MFLQKDIFGRIGLMSLSAVLKKEGHECDVLVDDLEKNIVQKALKINPDIIAFSITTGEFPWMRGIGTQIRKKFTNLIICGGAHPTFYPEVINEDYLDAICVGEGEEAIKEFVNTLEKEENFTKIQNFYVKKNGKIYKNEVRTLINDLDTIPFPDRKLYDRYSFFRNPKNDFNGKNLVMISRGCPFHCAFCFNKNYKELYRGKGKVFRRRSVSNVIKEIEIMKERNKYLNFLIFTDDIFTSPPKSWLYKFLEQYKEKIRIPFSIITRADLLDKDIIEKLRQANCYSIKMSLESSSDFIRNKILKKGMTNQQVIKAANLIRKFGLKLQLFNIIGNPGETLDMAIKTFELNKKVRPTYASCYLLNPYPGTEVFDYAQKRNYIDKNFDLKNINYSLHIITPIKMKNRREIWNLQNIFGFSVYLNLPTFLVRLLIKLPFKKLYELLFGITLMMLGVIKIHRANFINSLKVSLLNLSKHVFT